MPPKGSSNSKTIFSNPLQTQADDVKYRTKYAQLKVKLQQVEQDNSKLSLRILKSKKSIQRLRIERSILYDRLQSTTSKPTNPYTLTTSKHLKSLIDRSSRTEGTSYLNPMNAEKIGRLSSSDLGMTAREFGERPLSGVVGEIEGIVDDSPQEEQVIHGGASGAAQPAAPINPPAS